MGELCFLKLSTTKNISLQLDKTKNGSLLPTFTLDLLEDSKLSPNSCNPKLMETMWFIIGLCLLMINLIFGGEDSWLIHPGTIYHWAKSRRSSMDWCTIRWMFCIGISSIKIASPWKFPIGLSYLNMGVLQAFTCKVI